MRVLIVEDDKKQRELLCRFIEKSYINIKIYDAETIREAESILEEKSIDLFLVDINLPDGSGIDLVGKIRLMRKYSLTGIIFITTQVVNILDIFKSTHCYDFLIKPYNEDDIRNIIDVFYNEDKIISTKGGNYIIVSLENGALAKIYEDDIIFAEYSQRTCSIYTNKSVIRSKSLTLAKILECTSKEKIVQSHKSYIVNIKYIHKIEKVYQKIWEIHFLISKDTAQLSSRYKENIFRLWG